MAKGNIDRFFSIVGADPTGSGRWNYVYVSRNSNKVRIISVHQSVKSKGNLGTLCSQYLCYFRARIINTCPRKLFIDQLVQFVIEALHLGFKVITTVDGNDHPIK